jgi:hypothetical protein
VANITPLTPDSFQDFILRNKHALIHFWAGWNQYDQGQKKITAAEMPESVAAHVVFGSFEVDPPEHYALCRELKIQNLPFLALYHSGRLWRTHSGLLTQEKMIEVLRELIAV